MVDKSLAFGMQNFFFVQKDVSDGTYYYYGYMNKKGSILLYRSNKTVTETRYWIGKGDFTTVWAARAAKTYTTPEQLIDQSI
jgi:hypothetical protein